MPVTPHAKFTAWGNRLSVTAEQIADFCARWGVNELSLFGSVLRDDFTSASDVDVLVNLEPDRPKGPFDWLQMIEELQQMFGRKVDLVSKRALRNPFRRHQILTTREVLYAA